MSILNLKASEESTIYDKNQTIETAEYKQRSMLNENSFIVLVILVILNAWFP